MASRGPYRRHSPQFKIQICSDIRSDKLGRREALKIHNLSANLMQMWLGQFDRGELDQEDAAATTVAEYEAHIAALERKVSLPPTIPHQCFLAIGVDDPGSASHCHTPAIRIALVCCIHRLKPPPIADILER